MKNKTVRLLFPIVILGAFIAILAAITRFAESPNDNLPLNKVWIFRADDRIVATPILIDDQIIFRTANKIYSINAVNGSMNWDITARASTETINVNTIGKPIVGNSKFLVSEEKDNSIGIYSTKTGEEIWAVDGQVNSINALEIADDTMIVASHDGNLVVYDLTSHKELWEIALPPRSGTPIAANTDCVILGARNALRVYGLKDGDLLKEKMYDKSLVFEIALSGPNIFASHAKDGGDWTISSLRLDSLAEEWAFHAGKINHPYLSATNDRLSVFHQTLTLLDTNNGNVIWKDDSQRYYSVPAFHENNLFFISMRGMFDKNRRICKVEISKGALEVCSGIGSYAATQHLLGPLVANDLLIVPRGSEIVAFTMP